MPKRNRHDMSQNIWQIKHTYTQPYNEQQMQKFTDDAIDKLLSISDGDMAKLDEWITEQLQEIESEMKDEIDAEMQLLEDIDNWVADDDPCDLANQMLEKIRKKS